MRVTLYGAAIAVVTGVLFAGMPGAAAAAEQCMPRAPFAALQARIASLPAPAALAALTTFRDGDAADPNACGESDALAVMIRAREEQLVTLDGPGFARHSHAIFECAEPLATTTECNGLTGDMTAHPYDVVGGMTPLRVARPIKVVVRNRMTATRLVGLYRADVAGLVRGDANAVRKLGSGAATILVAPPSRGLTALIAIFSAPGPQRFCKFVWYYR